MKWPIEESNKLNMESVKSYIIMSASSLASVTVIMVVMALVHPRFFALVPGAFPADTTEHKQGKPQRSEQSNSSLYSALTDSSFEGESLGDTTRPEQQSAESKSGVQQQPLKESLTLSKENSDNTSKIEPVAADSLAEAELRKMVQIFESMDPEVAARILTKMDERAIGQVIARMKSRQSAKILATLDPTQAARILKGRKDS